MKSFQRVNAWLSAKPDQAYWGRGHLQANQFSTNQFFARCLSFSEQLEYFQKHGELRKGPCLIESQTIPNMLQRTHVWFGATPDQPFWDRCHFTNKLFQHHKKICYDICPSHSSLYISRSLESSQRTKNWLRARPDQISLGRGHLIGKPTRLPTFLCEIYALLRPVVYFQKHEELQKGPMID